MESAVRFSGRKKYDKQKATSLIKKWLFAYEMIRSDMLRYHYRFSELFYCRFQTSYSFSTKDMINSLTVTPLCAPRIFNAFNELFLSLKG